MILLHVKLGAANSFGCSPEAYSNRFNKAIGAINNYRYDKPPFIRNYGHTTIQ